MDYKEFVTSLFHQMKYEYDESQADKLTVPIFNKNGEQISRLRPIHSGYTDEEVANLRDWRNLARHAFLGQNESTDESVRNWLDNSVLANEDRIIFFVETMDGLAYGHVGASKFDFYGRTCEVGDFLRGRERGVRGGMIFAIQAVFDWLFYDLQVFGVWGQMFADNKNVIEIHRKRNGMQFLGEAPLRKVEKEDGSIQWVEDLSIPLDKAEKINVYMGTNSAHYQALNWPESYIKREKGNLG